MKYLLSTLILLQVIQMFSQNIGINNNDPKLSLDINGGLAHRSTTLFPYLNNVVVPDDISFVVISHIDVTNDVTIYFSGGYIDGRRLIIQNLSNFKATLAGTTFVVAHGETKEFICKNPGGYYLINESLSNQGWSLTGNTGTSASTNYVGTNDGQDLVFKTNGTEIMRLLATPLRTEMRLNSTLDDTTSTLLFVHRNAANEGIDFDISRKNFNSGEIGLNFSSKSNYPIFTHPNILHLSGLSGSVGVGTNTPSGKLTVGGHRSLGSNLPTLMLIDSSETNENGSSLQFTNALLTNNYQLTSHFGNSSILDDTYLTFSKNSYYLMRLRGDGNLGIGVINPTSKLDVNGDVAISNQNKLEFGKNLVKESNAGTIGYQRFSDGLDIVGAGEESDLSDRKVTIWAEGGTEMKGNAHIVGNANINGTLQIDGDAGTAGQVLTSNGVSMSPTWQSPPTQIIVRFGVDIPSNTTNTSLSYNQLYNTSPSDVTIGTSTITINKTGLYKFNGSLYTELLFTGVPIYMECNVALNYNGIEIPFLVNGTFQRNPWTSNNLIEETYVKTIPFEVEIYITSPTTIYLGFTIGFGMGGNPGGLHSRNTYGKIYGHLVSE